MLVGGESFEPTSEIMLYIHSIRNNSNCSCSKVRHHQVGFEAGGRGGLEAERALLQACSVQIMVPRKIVISSCQPRR